MRYEIRSATPADQDDLLALAELLGRIVEKAVVEGDAPDDGRDLKRVAFDA